MKRLTVDQLRDSSARARRREELQGLGTQFALAGVDAPAWMTEEWQALEAAELSGAAAEPSDAAEPAVSRLR
jgi:hypothetical protein